MANVTRIDWTIKTGDHKWSGTDTPVKLEIYRDSHMIIRLNLEPGKTSRLHKGELATYFWIFKSPDNIGTAVSGYSVPYYEEFPKGLQGHLKVKLVAKGDDAWEKFFIDSTVYSGKLKSVPNTIDSVTWVEDWEFFHFGQHMVLSTDSSEGFTTWTLNY